MAEARFKLAKPQHNVCAGCGSQFWSPPGVQPWCPKCSKLIETLSVDLNAAEMRKLKAHATIRGCTLADVIRLAIHEFQGKVHGRPGRRP